MDLRPTSNPSGVANSSGQEGEGRSDNTTSREDLWHRFRDPESGKPIEKPGEWAPALLEVRPGAGDWTELRLRCNGAPLPLRQEKVAGAVRTVASWPRSGPGRYRLRLLGAGCPREATVLIWPEKIGRGEYEKLLRDLESELPVQIAVTFQKAGGLAGVKLSRKEGTTLEQELVRLRRAIYGTPERMGLARALEHLAGRPHRVLTTEERWVRRGRARRPPADRLGQAFARPGNTEEGRLKEVPDARTRHTTDVYENRIVRQFVRQVQLRLLRIEPILQESGHGEAAQTAQDLLETIRAARRQARFLDEVSDLTRPPSRTSMILQRRPLYRAVFEGHLDFQKEISVTLEAPELEAPLRNLPFLYQLWCTLIVIRMATSVAGAAGFRVRRSALFQRKGGFLTLRLGQVAAEFVHPETGARLRIIPERHYGAAERGSLRSVSYAQRPDLALEVTDPAGEQTVYLFDPKYKLDSKQSGEEAEDNPLGAPTKPDIDKMHAYRDAIRDAMGRRVVRYAAILYPGKTEVFSEGLAAIGARPGQAEVFCQRIQRVVQRSLEAIGQRSHSQQSDRRGLPQRA